jgi:hypothetical protein
MFLCFDFIQKDKEFCFEKSVEYNFLTMVFQFERE